jgi:undecaprenyl-diphosphatase
VPRRPLRSLPLRPRPPAGSWARRALRTLGRLDQGLLILCRTRAHTPRRRRLALALSRFGEWGLGWVALGALGAGLDRDRRGAWLAASAIGPAAVAINYGVKLGVGRERPLLSKHPRLARAPSKLSCPSAHATSSLAAATTIARISPLSGPPLTALALAVCASRPFLGVHYPSDVVAGMLLGRELGRRWPLPGLPAPGQPELWAR